MSDNFGQCRTLSDPLGHCRTISAIVSHDGSFSAKVGQCQKNSFYICTKRHLHVPARPAKSKKSLECSVELNYNQPINISSIINKPSKRSPFFQRATPRFLSAPTMYLSV